MADFTNNPFAKKYKEKNEAKSRTKALSEKTKGITPSIMPRDRKAKERKDAQLNGK